VESSKVKEHDEELGDTMSLGEYLARAMGTFVERPKLVGDKVKLKVQNLFYKSAKSKGMFVSLER
jgi:hypothetical protein